MSVSGLHNIYIASEENPTHDDIDIYEITENPLIFDQYNNDSYEKNYIEGMNIIYNFMKKLL
jgi:hypothetical protein